MIKCQEKFQPSVTNDNPKTLEGRNHQRHSL